MTARSDLVENLRARLERAKATGTVGTLDYEVQLDNECYYPDLAWSQGYQDGLDGQRRPGTAPHRTSPPGDGIDVNYDQGYARGLCERNLSAGVR